MKNSIAILAITISLMFTSCHGLLDQEPLTNFAPENYFSSENEILTGINATYDPLSSGGGRNNLYYNGLPLILDFLSDDVYFTGSGFSAEAERLELSSANGFTRRAYLGYYEMVNRANLMIENIPNVKIPETRALRYTAEVRFLRAFAFYHLCIFYGEVPLRKESIKTFEDGPMPGAPIQDIFNFIEEDLFFAIDNLPWSYSSENYGRASKGAALALLAKSYMVQGKFQQAEPLISRIINDTESPHKLIEKYSDVFEVGFKNHPEHIFSARFAGGMEALNEGGILEERYGPPTNQVPAGFLPGKSNFTAKPSYFNGVDTKIRNGLINLFLEKNDPRLDQIYVNFMKGNPSQYYCDKFRDKTPHVSGNSSGIFPLIRYADVLLMYAEVLNEVNNGPTDAAYDAINQVRRRANNFAPESKKLNDLIGLNYESFKEAVMLERRFELAHEGHRWIDLVRTGKAIEVMSKHLGRNIESFRTLFPIPSAEIDANPEMKQNPGY